jgi:hypothetical protein
MNEWLSALLGHWIFAAITLHDRLKPGGPGRIQ